MQRTLADAILKPYREIAKPELPDDLPKDHLVPLLVTFRLGDLQSLDRTIQNIDDSRGTF